ncbi:hypothetical protein RUM44_013384 [Polyplax serrata]|uniref:Nose resistant-to-fluoxetine protein N-terminal domain-containing protein n=1 Tax=Polyplax serrata TaxID=468196 RepID=A0ABR1BHP2_POLSC
MVLFDASTKLPDGILAGNTFQMGHFDECLSVGVVLPEDNRKLKGQYCLAEMEYSPKNMEVHASAEQSNEIDLFNTSVWSHIKAFNLDRTKTRRDQIYWAVCIPDSCRPEDLKSAIEEAIRAVHENSLNVDVTVKVSEKFCQVAGEKFDLSWIGIPQLVMG